MTLHHSKPGPSPGQTHIDVLIIGAGITGAGIARDLALRGVTSMVVDRGDFNAGASGANHGLLHSGARYIASDPTSAAECRAENEIIRRIAPHCLEECGGLFVALAGDDEVYITDFPDMCARAGLAIESVDPRLAREMEPAISDKVVAAYAVNDAAVDPFRLTLENLAEAVSNGCVFRASREIVGFVREGRRIRAVQLLDRNTGRTEVIGVEMVVNAAGAWAGKVAALAGVGLNLVFSKGTLALTSRRLCKRVINRLRRPSDGEILVPGGPVSILGTTSVRIDDPDLARPTMAEIDLMVREGAALIPELEQASFIRAFAGVRPLLQGQAEEDRGLSRGFQVIDHAPDGPRNLITVTGGKLTTYRLMAEKATDMVAAGLGNTAPCRTADTPLPGSPGTRWTEPGRGPRRMFRNGPANGRTLCECEMVPARAVSEFLGEMLFKNEPVSLSALARRSRLGRGPCQGTFCAARLAALVAEATTVTGDELHDELRKFLNERWQGQRTVLWGDRLAQADLKQAIYGATLGLEAESDRNPG
jgi:glycerol-3-phosphate dehydrogenase